MNWNRIDLKLGAIIITLFFIILLILGFVINQLFTSFYINKVQEEADELSTHIVSMLEKQESTRLDLIGTLAEFSRVDIYLLDSQGNIVENASGKHVPKQLFITKQQNLDLLAGKKIATEYIDDKNIHYLVYGKPIKQGDHFIGGVYVLKSLEGVEQSIHQIRIYLLLSGLGAFLMAIGITFVISKKLSRPLIQMETVTRRIAKGDLETRVYAASNDEIGSLAVAINDLAKELQRYRDTRSEFFANISHELRTPITYLEGYADVLSQGLVEDEFEKKKYLDIISHEAKRLARLVHDLFELSKMEEGKIDLKLESIALSALIHQVVLKVELAIKEKGLEVIELVLPNCSIIGDGVRMEQIVLNLLDNAIRYTPTGSVVISLTEENKDILLCIEDSGIGIPEDELPYIFERFYRVEKSRSRQFGGTGLGLSIVKKLVELQGGTILVSSSLGQGTRFEIRFPSVRIRERQP
jgi:signal transduction histidine kinase